MAIISVFHAVHIFLTFVWRDTIDMLTACSSQLIPTAWCFSIFLAQLSDNVFSSFAPQLTQQNLREPQNSIMVSTPFPGFVMLLHLPAPLNQF